ncbi:MAG: DUF1284 domain-containing protein [Candidatus Sericytochromatia bacterium]|nr:DUF1284 domain-containing protein [Candidatus Sericytochromatia bacterium]
MTDAPAGSAPHLSLRGHHLLCTLHFQGAGYSTAFVENFKGLMEGVVARKQTRIQVAPLADDICGACPSLQADGETCAFQASIMRRDSALLDEMGWRPGDVLDLEEAHTAVLTRREALMEQVCPGCEWLPRCTANGPHGIASPLRRGDRQQLEELR